ncbi:Ubiquitin domain [Trypanosoma melophagium]|nr:Ubiquitin domain [Trypanosoma melophagium]
MISWNISLVPYGGALMTSMPSSLSPPKFPVGLVLRATWLVPAHTYQRGTQYTTSVEFGGLDRFVFDGANPLFLTIQDATQLERAIFHCTLHNLLHHVDSRDVAVPLPLPPLAAFAMERDVSWAAGVAGLGVLLASVRLVRQPPAAHPPPCPDGRCSRVNDPTHQAACAHVAPDWGRPPPNTPPGAYGPIMWESEGHIARAVQRRWRHDCVVSASPAVEHVRHLLDVLMGRAALDPGVARVVAIINQTSPTISQTELKQLLVSCAFHAKGMSPQEAARFCFFALRRDMEQAIARDDIVFMLENSLIGKTVDMPESEIQRRVTDIFGDTTYVIFDDFLRYFINNYAMWYAFGVPITTGEDWAMSSGGETSPLEASYLGPTGTTTTTTLKAEGKNDVARASTSTAAGAGAAVSQPTSVAAAAVGAGTVAASHEDSVWRRFVARVQHSNKAFSVTAHVNDTIADVMVMVQNSTGIRAACQEWRANGVLLDPKCTLGSTNIGLSKSDETTPEVTIIARDETVRLVMVYKDKGLRWELRMSSTEKVLRLRALVQQKTMIPLTRCVLRVRGTSLVDRHQLMYYHLQDGDVVNITQE